MNEMVARQTPIRLMTVSEWARACLRRPLHALHHRQLRAKRAKFYSSLVKPGELVFDIGANHGNRVEVFLSLDARVVAVEPQPRCLASLQRFREQHGELVQIFAGVAAPNSGALELQISNVDELSSVSADWIAAVRASGRFREAEWTEKLRVTATTLDALVAEYGAPTFIKIDVEGYELEVLRGLTSIPGSLRALSFEFTPERARASDSCLDYCAALAPITCNYSEGESMKWALPRWVRPQSLKSFLTRYAGDTRHFGDVYVRFSSGTQRS